MSVCVCLYFALLSSMQIAPFPHHITLPPLGCLAVPYFPTLSHNWYNFWKKFIEQKNVYFNFSKNLSKTFLILRRIQQYIITNVHSASRKVTVILVGFEWHSNFFDRVSKKYSSNENPSSGSRAVPSRQADIAVLTETFHNFHNALNNGHAKEI